MFKKEIFWGFFFSDLYVWFSHSSKINSFFALFDWPAPLGLGQCQKCSVGPLSEETEFSLAAKKCREIEGSDKWIDFISKTWAILIKVAKVPWRQVCWNRLKCRKPLTNMPDVNNFQQQIFAEMLLDMKNLTFNTNYVLSSVEAHP